MNLTELTKRARKYLSEAGNGLLDDMTIQAQVLSSGTDLARQWALFKAIGTGVATAGRMTPPSDFLGFTGSPQLNRINLQFADPAQLMSQDPGAYTATARAGTPRYYYWGTEYFTGGDVLLYPAGGGTLTFTYNRRPADPSASVQAWGGAHPEYHDLIALHAAQQLLAHGGATAAKEPIWLQRLEQRKDEFRAYLSTERRHRPTPRVTGPAWRQRWNR